MTNVERRLRELYKKAWWNGATGGGPFNNEKPSLTKDEKVEYQSLVFRHRLNEGWYENAIAVAEGAFAFRDSDTCEQCLALKVPVVLIVPGIVSRNKWGDWVCSRCDSRAATFIEMEKLRQVVGEESA